MPLHSGILCTMRMNDLQLHAANDKSHKHNIEQKKRETKEYILCDSIYI